MTLFTIILYYTIVRILIHLSKLILQHTSIHESFPNIRRTKGQQWSLIVVIKRKRQSCLFEILEMHEEVKGCGSRKNHNTAFFHVSDDLNR